jgi:hypothetical protein
MVNTKRKRKRRTIKKEVQLPQLSHRPISVSELSLTCNTRSNVSETLFSIESREILITGMELSTRLTLPMISLAPLLILLRISLIASELLSIMIEMLFTNGFRRSLDLERLLSMITLD